MLIKPCGIRYQILILKQIGYLGWGIRYIGGIALSACVDSNYLLIALGPPILAGIL